MAFVPFEFNNALRRLALVDLAYLAGSCKPSELNLDKSCCRSVVSRALRLDDLREASG